MYLTYINGVYYTNRRYISYYEIHSKECTIVFTMSTHQIHKLQFDKEDEKSKYSRFIRIQIVCIVHQFVTIG